MDLTLCTLCKVHQKKPPQQNRNQSFLSDSPKVLTKSRELCLSTSSKSVFSDPFCYELPRLGSRQLYCLHLFGEPMVAITHSLQAAGTLHSRLPRATGSSTTRCSSGSSCGERTTMGGRWPIAGFLSLSQLGPGEPLGWLPPRTVQARGGWDPRDCAEISAQLWGWTVCCLVNTQRM